MLLDEYMPAYDFGEAHEIEVRAAPVDAYRAVREVTPAEVPLLRTPFWIRSAPARRPAGSQVPFGLPGPLIEQALRSGFVLLAEDPVRELALGEVGQFWRIRSGVPRHLPDARPGTQPGCVQEVRPLLASDPPGERADPQELATGDQAASRGRVIPAPPC
ncbi:MAG: hypothetical protein M3Q29_09810 [Chloroflexota bacterium]|nr:hypothetical protein [Chloroflexota bacterium]